MDTVGVWDGMVAYWQANATAYAMVLVRIVFVVILAKAALVGGAHVTRRLMSKVADTSSEEEKRRAARLNTLLPLVLSIERYLVYFISVVIILQALGMDTSAIIASAGVAGLAFGFGAQNLVKDVISGFFLIFDNLVSVGDIVTIGSVSGMVERVDLRNILIRELNGQLWSIPNGDVRALGNFNREYSRVVLDIPIAYEMDTKKALAVLKAIADQWHRDMPNLVLEEPTIQAIVNFNASSVGMRVLAKTPASKHWDAARELRLRIKTHFDSEGIEIPYEKRVIINPTSSPNG